MSQNTNNSRGISVVDFILRDLESISKNDHTRIYDDNSVFARALIYLINKQKGDNVE